VKPLRILYSNYKGVTAWRSIIPGQIRFAVTEHHPEAQWIMDAHDVEKDAARSFAMRDIQQWDFKGLD
jgi:hypothetical protein